MKFFQGFTIFHACGLGLMLLGHFLPGGQPTKIGGSNLFGSGFELGFTISFPQLVGGFAFFYELFKARIKK